MKVKKTAKTTIKKKNSKDTKGKKKSEEPVVKVLNLNVNPENPRNGFFELDWNNEFIEKLLDAGYKGETNEQIVDGWFKTIARNILQEEGMDEDRGAGYINVKDLGKDKSEIS